MRRILDKCEQSKKEVGRDYITLRRGGAVVIEAEEDAFTLSFFAYNGKRKSAELLISPKDYSVKHIAERNHFIEINVSNKGKEERIYFDFNGNFVAMGTKESFVVRNGAVNITSRCGQLYSELPLQKLYM